MKPNTPERKQARKNSKKGILEYHEEDKWYITALRFTAGVLIYCSVFGAIVISGFLIYEWLMIGS